MTDEERAEIKAAFDEYVLSSPWGITLARAKDDSADAASIYRIARLAAWDAWCEVYRRAATA
jgi:hypothetical protein